MELELQPSASFFSFLWRGKVYFVWKSCCDLDLKKKEKKCFYLRTRARSASAHRNGEPPTFLIQNGQSFVTQVEKREKKEGEEEEKKRRGKSSKREGNHLWDDVEERPPLQPSSSSSSSSLSMQAAPSLAIGANSVEAPDCDIVFGVRFGRGAV